MINHVGPRWLLAVAALLIVNDVRSASFDAVQARKEIEDVNRRFCEALRRGDVGAVAELYAEDAKLMQPNDRASENRANIQATFKGFAAAGATELSLATVEVWGMDAMLAEEGRYVLGNKAGRELDRGKYIVLWRKIGGEWKITRDCFNSDLPSPPPAFNEAEVRADVAELAKALQAEERTAWVYHCTEDAVFVGPGEPPIRGRAKLLELANTMTPMRSVKIDVQRIEGSGTLAYAYIRGSWVTGPADKEKISRVRSLLALRKESDGRWRVAQELMHAEPEIK